MLGCFSVCDMYFLHIEFMLLRLLACTSITCEVWHQFTYCCKDLLLCYQSYTGMCRQFLGTEIDVPAGNDWTARTALCRCDDEVLLCWSPRPIHASIGWSIDAQRRRTLCHCQVEWPAINPEYQLRSRQQCCQLSHRSIRYEQHGRCYALCDLFHHRSLALASSKHNTHRDGTCQ